MSEIKISSEKIYDGVVVKLRKDKILTARGVETYREIVSHGGGACILAIKDGKILLVKQFRYPYKEELYEIPAGKLNQGEDPMQTAIRELEEEGGIRAKRVEKMFDIYPTPAYTNEIIRIYKATEFVETKSCLDEDEFLSAEWIDKWQVKKMIENGQIKDAKTIVAVLSEIK